MVSNTKASERELVDAVAEHADQLADPQRRERAVEREADVRVAPDPAVSDGMRRRRGDPRRSTVVATSVPSGSARVDVGRRQARARRAEEERALERGRLLERRAEAGAGRDRAWRARADPGAGRAQPGGARDAQRAGPRAPRRAPAAPRRGSGGASRTGRRRGRRVRNRSPIDATFWSGGIGSGMTSASGPRRRKNSAFEPSYSGTWRTEFSGPVRPANA